MHGALRFCYFLGNHTALRVLLQHFITASQREIEKSSALTYLRSTAMTRSSNYSENAEDQPLAPVDADLFLTSIAENFAGICNSSGSCFLRPSTHFIFILVETVAAKDVTLYKGGRGDPHQFSTSGEI